MNADKFVWDTTYACPLRCTHCYSESGRRSARTPTTAQLQRITDVILQSGAQRVSMSGGEPLLVRGWAEAARRLRDAGVQVTLFTSGWTLTPTHPRELADAVNGVCVSIDGATEASHDAIRKRSGSFRNAMAALEQLAAFKREREARGEPCYTLGVECTVIRSNCRELEQLVDTVTQRLPGVDTLRFGMAIPEGPAADEAFAERELLTDQEMFALHDAQAQLAARAHHGVKVSVTDMRYYIPYSPYGVPGEKIAHIEPDGQLRAFGVYEAKVGSILEEPFDVLWARALAWRKEPFVVEQIQAIRSIADWARAARVLDQRYGSADDLQRIALRQRSA